MVAALVEAVLQGDSKHMPPKQEGVEINRCPTFVISLVERVIYRFAVPKDVNLRLNVSSFTSDQ